MCLIAVTFLIVSNRACEPARTYACTHARAYVHARAHELARTHAHTHHYSKDALINCLD